MKRFVVGAVVGDVTLSAAQIEREFLAKAHQRNKPDPEPAMPLGGSWRYTRPIMVRATRARGTHNGRSELHFVIKMALRNALKLVRRLRKQVSDIDEDMMATKLIEETWHSAGGAGGRKDRHRQ
jgi:hypothetical protein